MCARVLSLAEWAPVAMTWGADARGPQGNEPDAGGPAASADGPGKDPEEAARPVRVLVVDDEASARAAMKRFLERGAFEVETAEGFEEASDKLGATRFDVVVCDIVMPGRSGLDLLERLRHEAPEVEVVLVTGHANVETVLDAMRRGAGDVLVKPLSAERLCGAVQHAARLKTIKEENRRYREHIEGLLIQRTHEVRESESRLASIVGESVDGIVVTDRSGRILFLNPAARRYLGKHVHEMLGLPLPDTMDGQTTREIRVAGPTGETWVLEVRATTIPWARRRAHLIVLRDVTALTRATEEREKALGRTLKALRETAEVLATAVEMRDPYTSGHQRRVTMLACAIYDEMGLPPDGREGLRIAGMVHDVGKLQVPTEILVKPGRLTELEYRILQGHARAGHNLLKGVDFPWPVARMVLQHHERMDGSGYPDGASGDGILMEARILAVADVVEAMASHRPYRPALGVDTALAEIEAGAGTLYDPDVARSCIVLFRHRGFTWT